MKTKHLFLATALMASFAACTNEEIVSEQQNVAAGRPTVDNVKLTFGENADSRLVYNKGYKWETTDIIGALLMDQPTASWHAENTQWAAKYELSHHIHTSYPFTYNTEDKTWGCNAKMLEGNYFFAFPWESYDGQRQVSHSLIAQEQVGVGAEVRAASYANNQFFIGYDRIVAGTQATEALNNVEMTPVLGAIQLQIVNTGTQDYHINKVVLKGEDLGSVLTFDPKDANFNSANYLGLEKEDAYNADEDYDKEAALIEVVKKVTSDHDKFSQLYIKGTEEERLLEAKAGNTAYVLIMATPDDTVEDLTLDIYTDEGVVLGIDLTKINKEIDGKKTSAITSSKVKAIGSDVVNTIKVQIDDNSFNVPENMDVYNNDDLLQFIQWNANTVGAREVTATLKKDATLTAEMVETLALNKNMELTIDGSNVLTLAADLDEDILDAKNLNITTAIKVLGELILTKASDAVASIEVAEGAELSIFDKQVNEINVVNNGTLTIGEKANITEGEIVNNAEMTVAENAYVKAEVENNGEIENNGTMNKGGVDNSEDAKITLGEDAVLVLNSNNGLVVTAKGAVVSGDNTNGRIEFVKGAKIGNIGGIIYREVEGAVANEPTGTSATNVNTWVVVDDITFAADAKIKNIEIDGNYDIEVATGKTLTIENELTITGVTVTDGAIKVANVVVEEDAEWTNLGTIEVTNVNGIDNDGAIDNRGGVTLPANSSADILGEWEGNDATIKAGTDNSLQEAYNDAVEMWWATATQFTSYVGNDANDIYNYNPMDAERFAICVLGWYNDNQGDNFGDKANALFKKFGYINANGVEADSWKVLNSDNKLKTLTAEIAGDAEFAAAVNAKVLTMTGTALTSLKGEFITKNGANQDHLTKYIVRNNTTVFESEDAAMTELYKKYATPATLNAAGLNKYVNIWQFTADIKNAFANSVFVEASKTYEAKYAYVWEGCDLDNVVKVMSEGTFQYWKSAGYTTMADVDAFYTMEGVIDFLKNAKMIGKTEGAAGQATIAASTYLEAAQEWGYSDTQVKILAKDAHGVSLSVVIP